MSGRSAWSRGPWQEPGLSLNAAVSGSARGWGSSRTPCVAGVGRPIDAGLAPGTRPGRGSRVSAGEPRAEAGRRESCRRPAFFAAASSTAFPLIVAFIDEHRDRFGVEPICRVLSAHGVQVAPSGYYAHHARPVGAARRDERLLTEIIECTPTRRGRGCTGRARCGTSCAARARRRRPVPRCRSAADARRRAARGRRGRPVITTRPERRRCGRRTWSTATSRRPPEPAVGGRLHLRADLVRDGVHRVRLRCVLAADRRLAHRHQHAHRAAAGCVGDGVVDPRPSRATTRPG